MTALLEGVRVLDLSWLLLDYIGLVLANDGAEVIHVEEPRQGDYMRWFLGQIKPGWSPPFLVRNSNKKSFTVNLKSDEGLSAFNQLAASADVLLTVYTADVPARLGIDYESIRKINPEIIYVQVTGYGASGPYSRIPTHGEHFDAHSGAYDFRVGEGGLPISDLLEKSSYRRLSSVLGGSLVPTVAIVGALLERERTRKGRFMDISAGDCVMATDWFSLTRRLNEDKLGPPDSAALDAMQPGATARLAFYATVNERYVAVDLREEEPWQSFCRAVDQQELAAVADDEQLRDRLKTIFGSRGSKEWREFGSEHQLPIGPVVFPEDLPADANVRARHCVQDMQHPVVGPWYVNNSPLRQEPTLERPTPKLGEHTEELLLELGYSTTDYARLKETGIV
jgi:crotonobetainyl-CoA:carnitine CoA-transferase CaiB-like acyl-CoA transferase